jgi:hypothetical protein
MAILRIGAFGKRCMVPAPFENDDELACVLAENPELLAADGERPPMLVTRSVALPDRTLDCLLLLDARSIPVVVEPALASMERSGRDLVGDAIDTVSALAQLTVAQLDAAAGGAVERALTSWAEGSRDDFARRWSSLGAHLRAARVRLIAAVDRPTASLDRRIQFLADHSDLEVRCVSVAKFRDEGGDSHYAPTVVFDGGAWTRSVDRQSAAELPIRLVGSPVNYRRRRGAGLQGGPPVPAAERVARPAAVELERIQWDG